MKAKNIEIIGFHGVTVRGIYQCAGAGISSAVIALPGLGATVGTSKMVQGLLVDAPGKNFDAYAFDHPSYGLNEKYARLDDGFHDRAKFDLNRCIESVCAGINNILCRKKYKQVALVGNSLGFWALFNAAAQIGAHPKLRLLLGKSGVESYKRLLQSLFVKYGATGNTDIAKIESLLEKMGANDHSFSITVNPEQGIIRIPCKFVRTIPDMTEATQAPIPVEVWHGGRDPFTSIGQIATLRGTGDSILVHAFSELSHGLNPQADKAIIDRLIQHFAPIISIGDEPPKKLRRMGRSPTPLS